MNTHKQHLKTQQKLVVVNITSKTPEEICDKYHITLQTYQRIKKQYGTPNSIVRQFNQVKRDYFRLKSHAKKQAEIL